MKNQHQDGENEIVDRLVKLNRVATVVEGGRRFSFGALVVVGDTQGRVGYGYGKAKEVPEAIRKAVEKAKKSMEKVSLINGTIPHRVVGYFGGGKVLLLPASPGTGVIAGGAVRAVLESAGVTDILSKCLGSRNPQNVVKATMEALRKLSSIEDTARRRGLSVEDIQAAAG